MKTSLESDASLGPTLSEHVLEELAEISDVETAIDLANTFMVDAEARIDKLCDALKENQTEAVQYQAHGLAGSCGNVGAMRLMNIARRIEEKLRSGDNAVGELASALSGTLEVTKGEVRRWAEKARGGAGS
jgi:HPt (histidine-containing phosphotransfer) domain-containing protein